MESTSEKRQTSASMKRRSDTIQVVKNCDGRINIYFPHRKRKKTSNNDDQSGKSSISLSSSCVSLSGLSRVPDSQEVQVGSGGEADHDDVVPDSQESQVGSEGEADQPDVFSSVGLSLCGGSSGEGEADHSDSEPSHGSPPVSPVLSVSNVELSLGFPPVSPVSQDSVEIELNQGWVVLGSQVDGSEGDAFGELF